MKGRMMELTFDEARSAIERGEVLEGSHKCLWQKVDGNLLFLDPNPEWEESQYLSLQNFLGPYKIHTPAPDGPPRDGTRIMIEAHKPLEPDIKDSTDGTYIAHVEAFWNDWGWQEVDGDNFEFSDDEIIRWAPLGWQNMPREAE
jgi:hypothetical protein